MTAFNVQIATPADTAYVKVDNRFDVAIERTAFGLALHIYPLTEGELWDEPFTTFHVAESDIIALEKEMGAP